MTPHEDVAVAGGFGDATTEAAELHHRVANMFQIVSALLARQAGQAKDGVIVDALTKADMQIRAFAVLHQILRAHSNDGGDLRCAATYLEALCPHLDAACLAPQNVDLNLALTKPSPLTSERCRDVGLIVTELVMNAAKHAFQGCEQGSVCVGICPRPDLSGHELVVADDGAGMPEPLTHRGQGLGFVDLLVRGFRGSTELTSGPGGTRVVVHVPIA